MVPAAITRENILAAIAAVDRDGIPAGRSATKFLLHHGGKTYPPKYVISVAARIATGQELPPWSFNGGAESNNFLAARGFTIVQFNGPQPISTPRVSARLPRAVQAPPVLSPPAELTPSPKSHNQSCPDCKATVLALLKSLYGEARPNCGMEVGAMPADFIGTPHYPALKKIYEALQDRRGFREFVRTARLPNCDFFVPNPGFVVEFDESQHFTAARADTLRLYPEGLPIGYDRREWVSRCNEIAVEDHDPPFRDEQRAWYDTLRDFLPIIKGLHPTIRLYAKRCVWCSLNPNNSRDLDTFRQILGTRADFWSTEMRACPDAVLARLVINGVWNGDVALAKTLLLGVNERWAGHPKVKCLSTCGAFLTFDFPDDLPAVRDNLNPPTDVVNHLIARASRVCDQLLDESTVRSIRSVCDYLTLGVDSSKPLVSTTHNLIAERHVELVCLVDLRTGARHWTGKFYPTSSQAGTIIRLPDLKSHFVDLDCGRAMVLGCHDMTVFNPRSQANAGGWRKRVSEGFRALAKETAPLFVLHHPHTAVKSRTWCQAWSGLYRELPSVKHCVGTGAYSMADEGWSGRSGLDDVLTSTKQGRVLDVIVRIADVE